jgi:hypothetical protein
MYVPLPIACSERERVVGIIGVVGKGYMQLAYSRRGADSDESEQLSHPVLIEWTPCPYGGSRPWFRCPRCNARRAVLHGLANDGRFGCRGCLNLVYTVEDERKMNRVWRKRGKIEAKLVSGWKRPKGMHWATFRYRSFQLNEVLEKEHALFIKAARKYLDRTGWPPPAAVPGQPPAITF